MDTNVNIRQEQNKDFFNIAEVHATTFTHSYGMGEVGLVDGHRHRVEYDPDLSILAELDGKIVGHTLLTARWVKLSNQRMKVVIVGPVAVLPDWQKRGVGRMMLEEGHRRAAVKGYEFALLLGHSDYYPRFGYVTNMFGKCQIQVNREDVTADADGISERRVRPEDIEQLVSWWNVWTRDVDLSIYPGNSVLDWISPNKGIIASVLEKDGAPIAYVRYNIAKPDSIGCFLAADSMAVNQSLAYIARKSPDDAEILTVPVHPDASITKQFFTMPYEGENSVWEAAMIKVLNPTNRVIQEYCQDVKSKRRAPGQIIWPVEFDVC